VASGYVTTQVEYLPITHHSDDNCPVVVVVSGCLSTTPTTTAYTLVLKVPGLVLQQNSKQSAAVVIDSCNISIIDPQQAGRKQWVSDRFYQC
jgi:hypothetical protein